MANPDKLRMHGPALDFVRACFEAGTPVGVICHGPWTLVEEFAEGRHPVRTASSTS